MKPLARIGNWKVYKMNGEVVALDNRGKEFSRRFATVKEAIEALEGVQ